MTDVKVSPADALDAMRHQLDPVDDWREPLERAAHELRRLAAVEAAYDGKAHELLVLEHSYDRLTDDRDQLIEQRDDLRADRDRLAAEVTEWERLRDPAVLHAALLRGLPAQLTPEQVWHLAADDRVRLGDLEAEVEALRAANSTFASASILPDHLEIVERAEVAALRADAERWALGMQFLSAAIGLAVANRKRGDDCGMLARTLLSGVKAMNDAAIDAAKAKEGK